MDQMTQPSKNRPLSITMVCSFYFIFWAVNVVSLIAGLIVRIGGQFGASLQAALGQIPLVFVGARMNVSWLTWVIAGGLVVGIIGYWLFKKWGVVVYVAATLALLIATFPPYISGTPKTLYSVAIFYTLATIFSLNIFMIILGLINFRKMK